MPILLDKWAVPRGQMLPLFQEQSSSFSSSSFQYLENNWITPPPRAFSSPAFPSPALSSTSCPSPALNAITSSTHISQTAVLSQAADANAGGQVVANQVVTLQILDTTSTPDAVADATAPALGGRAMTTAAVNLDAVWDPLDQTIVLSFSLPPPAALSPRAPPPEPWGVELERDSSTPGPPAAAAPERWASSFDALTRQSGVSGRPITTGVMDKAGPYWLDLLLDDSLCIPEAIFETNQSHGTP